MSTSCMKADPEFGKYLTNGLFYRALATDIKRSSDVKVE